MQYPQEDVQVVFHLQKCLIMEKKHFIQLSAIPLAAAIRHAGIVGMRSGVLTRSSIVQSVFGLEHRKILFKCLCIEMFTAKQINSLLSKWLDHYFKPNSNEEKAAFVKNSLARIYSTCY